MKKIFTPLLLLLLFGLPLAAEASLYQQKIKSVDGETIELAKYQGSPLLIVNIATRCGYTDQLDDLEKLYQKYKDRGLKVLGIPSNDFAGQTPEGNEEIAKFCRLEYGVSFDLTERVSVKGEKRHPIISSLLPEDQQIGWNFEKFIIDKDGQLKAKYPSKVEPLSQEIIRSIEAILWF